MEIEIRKPAVEPWWPRWAWVLVGLETILVLYLVRSTLPFSFEHGLPMFDSSREMIGLLFQGLTWLNVGVVAGLWLTSLGVRPLSPRRALSLLGPAVLLLLLSNNALRFVRAWQPDGVVAKVWRVPDGRYGRDWVDREAGEKAWPGLSER